MHTARETRTSRPEGGESTQEHSFGPRAHARTRTDGRENGQTGRGRSTSQACNAESLRCRKLDQLLQHFGDTDAAEDRAGEYAENAVRFFLFCLARGEARGPEAAAAIVRPLLLDAETVFAVPDRRSRGHAFCCSRPCSAVFKLYS